MAVAAQKTVASLMQKTLDRQAALARLKLRFSKNQIEQILLNYARGGSVGPYGELVKVLKEYPLNDDNYRIVFDDCLSCVVVLGRDFKPFVDVVCEIDWANRNEELVKLYNKFVINLVTAHTYHCPQVITCLVKLFKAEDENWEDSPHPRQIIQWSNIHTIIAQIVAIMPITHAIETHSWLAPSLVLVALRRHSVTQHILAKAYVQMHFCFNIQIETWLQSHLMKWKVKLKPRTSDLLIQIIIEQFPYYKAGCYANRAYIHNLIWMSKYIPSLREQIMTAIINRMIIMDVNMVERDKNKVQNETIFEMDLEDRDEISDALDFSMLEVLRWLEDEREPILNLLCTVFERFILPTYGIRHVQFLLLYTVSINQQCADRILNNLWAVAAGLHGLGPGALATRRTAAGHLAGLLARCVRVPNTRLIHYLKTMADWCHSYITATQESTTTNDNIKAHGAFHAICHAIFYLVAFKHHHLFMSKESVNFVESLNLPRLVTCALNPLRTCAPQVTRAFAGVTRAHQLVYCQAIIEKNARHTLRSAALLRYDAWFPYDPYTLPRSGKIIWPLCIEYKDWLKEGDDETQYTIMKKKLEGDDDDFLMSASPCQKLASSLSNCISPGFITSENVSM